nr:hypothetical protein Iba_chr08aCG11260 [Ipomoea batatas]
MAAAEEEEESEPRHQNHSLQERNNLKNNTVHKPHHKPKRPFLALRLQPPPQPRAMTRPTTTIAAACGGALLVQAPEGEQRPRILQHSVRLNSSFLGFLVSNANNILEWNYFLQQTLILTSHDNNSSVLEITVPEVSPRFLIVEIHRERSVVYETVRVEARATSSDRCAVHYVTSIVHVIHQFPVPVHLQASSYYLKNKKCEKADNKLREKGGETDKNRSKRIRDKERERY